MLDLNSLTLYKNKINSYLDENALSISTKSNILNMFKIKNYTGKGIEPHGSVQIDAILIVVVKDFHLYVILKLTLKRHYSRMKQKVESLQKFKNT